MEKQKSIICRGWNKARSQTSEVSKCPQALQDSPGCFGGMLGPLRIPARGSKRDLELWGAGGDTRVACWWWAVPELGVGRPR